MRASRFFLIIFLTGAFLYLAAVALSVAEESVPPLASPAPAATTVKTESESIPSTAASSSIQVAPDLSATRTAETPAATTAPVDPKAPKVFVNYPDSTNTIRLTDEQTKKMREILARSKVNAAQKQREKEMLDKTPVLEQKLNPNVTERGSIPKRF
jgi:hypothetical protein